MKNEIVAKFFLFTFLSCDLLQAATDKVLVIPIPSLPTTFDPVKSLDVYSNSAIRQIHRTLFQLNTSGEPEPDLVKNFKVEDKGLSYHLIISNDKFSNGISLKSDVVISSLQRAIRSKVNGYQKFSCINGFENFIDGQSTRLEGLSATGVNEVRISLNCKIPRLPYLLSDLRFAIVYSEKSPEIGLGSYKVDFQKNKAESEATLRSVSTETYFSIIKYIKSSKDEAVKILLNNKVDSFIFSYKFSQEELKNFEGHANVIQMRSWTNYFVAINSYKNPQKEIRSSILSVLDRKKIVESCFPEETIDDNIFPFGFPGYVSGFQMKIGTNRKYKNLDKKRKYRVSILNGVGNEICLKRILTENLGRNFDVEIIEANIGLRKWISKKTDIILFFLESELNLDVSQFFTLDADFFLGDKNDRKILKLAYDLNNSIAPAEFRSLAIELQNRVLDQNLLLPIFIPKSQILYSKNVSVPDLGMIPPTYMHLKNIERLDREVEK
ncbi:MAG: hypothetical protein JNL11_03075 [Bdellovibrionaceae bacterium]|nr:hypothetical protein [Pseudobdellovibrionaceae bacterium]